MSSAGSLFPAPTAIDVAVDALRQDLLAPGGPRISIMKNYPFAILPYRKLEQLLRLGSTSFNGFGIDRPPPSEEASRASGSAAARRRP